MKVKRLSIFILLVLLTITACGGAQPAEIISLEEPISPIEDSPPEDSEILDEEAPAQVPDLSNLSGSQTVINRKNAGELVQIDYLGKGNINSMAWSPLGSPIALATTTGIYLIDAQTYQEEHFSLPAAGYVTFSPDGKLLASAEGSLVILRDAKDGSELRVLEGHAEEVYHIAFSPIENLLATASQDETVKLWDLDSGEELTTLKGTGTFVYYVAFLPDGKTLISVAYDQQIILWDVESGAALTVDSEIAGSTLAVSPFGEMIAAGGYVDSLTLYDYDGQVLFTLDEAPKPVRDLAFSPDGKILASTTSLPDDIGMKATVRLWDTASGELLHTLDDEGGYFRILFSPDGTQIATAAIDKVKLWYVESGQEIAIITDQTLDTEKDGYGKGGVIDFAWSPDGSALALATNVGVNLVNLQTQEEIQLTTHGYQPQFGHIVSFSPDGNLLAVSNYKSGDTFHGSVDIFDVVSQELLITLDDFEEVGFFAPFGIAFSPDGAMLATGRVNSWGGGLGGVKFWDVSSGALIDEFSHEGLATILNLTFDKEGSLMAGISENGSVYVWDLSTGQAVQNFQGTSGYGGAVAISPDGKLLAAGGAASDGRNYGYEPAELHLFALSSGELKFDLEGHESLIRSLSFNVDGSVLASASWDDTVRLWDVETGQQLAKLAISGATSVAFSPVGTLLATAGSSDVLRLWGTTETAASYPENLAREESRPIPALALGDDFTPGVWSQDGRYYFYSQQGPMDEPGPDQATNTLTFLDTHTGEICPGLIETLTFEMVEWGAYPKDPHLQQRTFWMADQRLLYLSPDGELSAITPCGETSEDWTESLPEPVTNFYYHEQNDPAQLLIRGLSSPWLFTPSTGQSVKVDIPISNSYGETWFSWSPWEAKLVSSRLEEREDWFGIVVEDIDLTTGKASLVLELPIEQAGLSKDNPHVGISWLAKDVLNLGHWLDYPGHDSIRDLVIDISDQPDIIADVYPDLFGIESLSTENLSHWGGIGGMGGRAYYFVVCEGLSPSGQCYLYSAETELVETYSFDPPKLLVFPNGNIAIAESFEEILMSEDPYQIIQIGMDREPYNLDMSGRVPGQSLWGKVRMIPGGQQLLIATDQGISLVDLESGEILQVWVLENQTQYDDFNLDPSPDGQKIIIHAQESYQVDGWPGSKTTAIFYLQLDN